MPTTAFTRRAMTVLLAAAGLAATGALATTPSAAEIAAYPSKPIRIVVPYTAGGFNDALARAIAAQMQASMKQAVIIDNRAGAGTVTGTQAVARAAPDGYTLLEMPAAFAINAALMPKLPYDSMKDFSFITLVAKAPFLLISNPSFPAKTVPELVKLAKAKPGGLSYSSTGNGGNAHLMGEMLKSMANIDVLHVPYKGAGPSMNDLISGQVQYSFATYAAASASIKAGRLRAIAVTSKERWSRMPELPTIAEAGYPRYEAIGWWGFAAPAGTPAPIIERLQREINKALASKEVQQYLEPEGVEAVGSTPAEFRQHLQAEIAEYRKVIKAAGIQPD